MAPPRRPIHADARADVDRVIGGIVVKTRVVLPADPEQAVGHEGRAAQGVEADADRCADAGWRQRVPGVDAQHGRGLDVDDARVVDDAQQHRETGGEGGVDAALAVVVLDEGAGAADFGTDAHGDARAEAAREHQSAAAAAAEACGSALEHGRAVAEGLGQRDEAPVVGLHAVELGIRLEPERAIFSAVRLCVAQQRPRALQRQRLGRGAEVAVVREVRGLRGAALELQPPADPGIEIIALGRRDLTGAAQRILRVALELHAVDHPAGVVAELDRFAQVDVERALDRSVGQGRAGGREDKHCDASDA